MKFCYHNSVVLVTVAALAAAAGPPATPSGRVGYLGALNPVIGLQHSGHCDGEGHSPGRFR